MDLTGTGDAHQLYLELLISEGGEAILEGSPRCKGSSTAVPSMLTSIASGCGL